MEPYAIITPTRDRPKMLEFCKYQVSQFTIKPEKHYIIDYPPISNDVDISERVFMGVQKAKEDGINLILIIEDDDNYGPYYPEILLYNGDRSCDFFGFETTFYYNIGNRTWQEIKHPLRSSLFSTGFKISALSGFVWPKSTPFVDIALWKHAQNYNNRLLRTRYSIGIKNHGEGKAGGKGHRMIMKNKDPDCTWLQQNVSKEAYEFYMTL